MKRGKSGLTLVELLTVLAIMALLVGVLIPALSAVKNSAKEAKQKGQLTAIELALTAFKNDDGDYPPSTGVGLGGVRLPYCGAQKLAEALVGRDLLGFDPRSKWELTDGAYADVSDLSARKGPYLELATTNAFKLGLRPPGQPPTGLFAATAPLAYDTYVLCDVFGATKVSLPDGTTKKAGAPILYYKANPSGSDIHFVYDNGDNEVVVYLKATADGKTHPLDNSGNFYDYITDPKITAKVWPYRPNSYILISAGADGIYGTGDDIRNFGD